MELVVTHGGTFVGTVTADAAGISIPDAKLIRDQSKGPVSARLATQLAAAGPTAATAVVTVAGAIKVPFAAVLLRIDTDAGDWD